MKTLPKVVVFFVEVVAYLPLLCYRTIAFSPVKFNMAILMLKSGKLWKRLVEMSATSVFH